MDGTTSLKINKETKDLNDPINELNLADMISTLPPTAARWTLLKHTPRTFSKISHTLVHITSFSKLKRIEIIQSMFSSNNDIKLEINNKEIWGIQIWMGEIKHHTSTSPVGQRRNQERNYETYFEMNEMKMWPTKHKGCSWSSAWREIHSSGVFTLKDLHNLAFHLMQLGKKEQIKPKGSRQKEIIETSTELSDLETRKATEISETKIWFFIVFKFF